MRDYCLFCGWFPLARMLVVGSLSVGLAAGCSDEPDTSERENPSSGDDDEDDTASEPDDDSDGEKDAGKPKDAGSPKDAGKPKDTGKPDSSAGDALLDAGRSPATTDSGETDSSTSVDTPDGWVYADGLVTLDKPPFEATGAPIMAPDKTWTWIEFPETKCRDGSAAGIVVNLNSTSKNLMLFMEAGGACFDFQTCLVSPPTASQTGPGNTGIFNRNQSENPVKDWNFVYVPYCTGDVHLGTREGVMIEGVDGPQNFTGRRNMEAFLTRLVPTFSDAEKLLVTGTSAGGFAASATMEVVGWAFGFKPQMSMIDDSGPPMSREFLPECLTNIWREVWGLDGGIIGDCGDACSADGDFEMEILARYLKTFHFVANGVLEAIGDSIISGFYGIGTNGGANDCNGILLLTPMDAAQFRDGLLDYRERVKSNPLYSTYYPPGAQHTWLQSDGMYSTTVGGVRLIDWITNIIDGKPAGHVGP